MPIAHASPSTSAPPRQLRLADGYRLGYARYGDPAGRPLLFFHGWPGSAIQAALADSFGLEHGWQILAFDRPGMGWSQPLPGYRLLDWPPLVAEALDIFGWERCHLMAVSGGAPGAHACLATIPGRFTAVGLCGGAPPLAELDHTHDLFPLFRLLIAVHGRLPALSAPLLGTARSYLQLMDDARAMRPWLGLLPRPDRAALRDEAVLRRVTASLRSAYRQGPHGLIADGNTLLGRWDFDWRRPGVPLHFWHGARDRTVPPRMARWTADRIVGEVHFRTFPGEGHFSLPIRRLADMVGEWEENGKR
jgi:pimeloyl-ACP methyl ester carboxylesterase